MGEFFGYFLNQEKLKTFNKNLLSKFVIQFNNFHFFQAS